MENGKMRLFHGDIYYYINSDGDIFSAEWKEDEIDLYRYYSNNFFVSRYEAERKLEMMLFIQQRQVGMNVSRECYHLKVDTIQKTLIPIKNELSRYATFCFPTLMVALEVASFIGYDDFITYFANGRIRDIKEKA